MFGPTTRWVMVQKILNIDSNGISPSFSHLIIRKKLYAASNHLHVTTNEGQSWEIISPDLTRNDPSTLGPSGGPITKDNTGVEYYGTIFAAAESAL